MNQNKKNNKKIGQLKDYSVYILNDVKHIMQDIPNDNCVDEYNRKYKIVKIIDKRKYKQAVSECNKW